MQILWTQYNIIEDGEGLKKINADGECRPYGKVIKIRSLESMLGEDATDAERKARYDETLRHEVIHAFFHECGHDDYSNNEELVDCLAIQFPKLLKLFKELDCCE